MRIKKPRRKPNATEREASALLQVKRACPACHGHGAMLDGVDGGGLICGDCLGTGSIWLIPEPLRSEGTAAQVVAAVDYHHWKLFHAQGGGLEPQNIEPMLRAEHKIETAKKTIPEIAKSKRVIKANAAHEKKMADKGGYHVTNTDNPIDFPPSALVKPKRKWPSRPMDGSKKSPWARKYDKKSKRWVTVKRDDKR